MIRIHLSKADVQKLKRKTKDYKKSNKSYDLYSSLLINENTINKYFDKPSRNVSMSTCFGVFKLSCLFEIKPDSNTFFEIEDCTVNDILINLSKIIQTLQDEEDEKTFDNFLESGDLIRLLSQNIDECFTSNYFKYLKITRIIQIIEKRIESGLFIPSNKLFLFISKSINEYFVLLRYLNFNYLRSVTSIPINDFKQYVILLIKQYDECLSKIMALNHDKSKQSDYFNNLYKNGNQIAAFYLYSQTEKQTKTNNNPNKAKDEIPNIKNRIDFSKTTIQKGKIKSQLNLVKFEETDDDYDNISRTQKVQPKSTQKTKTKTQLNLTKKGQIKTDNDYDEEEEETNNIKNKKSQINSTINRTQKSAQKKPIEKVPTSKSQLTKKGQIAIINNYEEEDYSDDSEYYNDENNYNKISKTTKPITKPPSKTKPQNVTPAGNFQREKTFKAGQYYRPITVEDKERIEIWKETFQILSKGYYKIGSKKYKIDDDIDFCIKNTKCIRPSHKFKVFFEPKRINSSQKHSILKRVFVENSSTFEAARKLNQNDRNDVCVLNFASAVQPGGGVKNGRGAQEETLSRMSSLYMSLFQAKEMYECNKKENDPFYSDYMIYSPDVVVFRDDDYNLIKFYHVSVISAAAVNFGEVKKIYGDSKKVEKSVYKAMKRRCRKILSLCLENDIQSIVLGAFGCGVFKNRPEDVSEIFRELIVDEGWGLFFDKIVFAIKSPTKSPNYTLKQFRKAFDLD